MLRSKSKVTSFQAVALLVTVLWGACSFENEGAFEKQSYQDAKFDSLSASSLSGGTLTPEAGTKIYDASGGDGQGIAGFALGAARTSGKLFDDNNDPLDDEEAHTNALRIIGTGSREIRLTFKKVNGICPLSDIGVRISLQNYAKYVDDKLNVLNSKLSYERAYFKLFTQPETEVSPNECRYRLAYWRNERGFMIGYTDKKNEIGQYDEFCSVDFVLGLGNVQGDSEKFLTEVDFDETGMSPSGETYSGEAYSEYSFEKDGFLSSTGDAGEGWLRHREWRKFDPSMGLYSLVPGKNASSIRVEGVETSLAVRSHIRERDPNRAGRKRDKDLSEYHAASFAGATESRLEELMQVRKDEDVTSYGIEIPLPVIEYGGDIKTADGILFRETHARKNRSYLGKGRRGNECRLEKEPLRSRPPTL